MSSIPFLPPSASANTGEFNLLFVALLAITVAVLGLVFLLMFGFCIRYRKSSIHADRSHRIKKSWVFEIAWTAGSFGVFLGLYAWGADLYLRNHRPPVQANDIYVIGKQWMWQVEHPDGQREINTIHLAVGRPVRFVMTSQDVIHGFYIPAFRLKQDVLPGRYVTTWVTPTELGRYQLYCSQFCGTDHAAMAGGVVVMSGGDYARWLEANASAGTLATQGGAVYRRFGCSGCHGANSGVRAPPLDGLYGSTVVLKSGATATADESFIRNAIVEPAQNPLAGYPAIMPSFAGQIGEADIVALVAYVKSLGTEKAAP